MPTVAVSGSTVHVAWCDSTTGNWKVYYKLSADNGITWGADTQLSSNSFISKYVTLAASGSNVHLVWTDIRVSSTGYLYYKRSINGGISWGAETKLTKNTFSNAYPSLAVNGSVLHLTFMRLIKSSWEIFYISSSNNGTKWGSDVQLTNNASYSSVPSIAVSGSNVHIIFRDDRDGNYEIYYKRYIGAFNFKPTGITDNDPELLSVYSLSQNYPNPFNPVTNINFQLPADNFTTMIIYDIAGRVVETLVNNNLQAGTYQVSWNGSKYSSGVYFYRLTSGEFSDIKSLILLK
jgi:hypothetical protein